MELEKKIISFSLLRFTLQFQTFIFIIISKLWITGKYTTLSVNFIKKLLIYVSRSWRLIGCVGFPIILLPILSLEDKHDTDHPSKFRCAYATLLISLYWTFKVVPVAIPSILPVVLFPVFGVMDTSEVTLNYMRESNMMLVGGLIIAHAVEHTELNRKICYKLLIVLMEVEILRPHRVLFSIMFVTAILSMWTSNAGTTLIMVPIAMAIIENTPSSSNGLEGSEYGSRKFDADAKQENIRYDATAMRTESKIDILESDENSLDAENDKTNLKRMYLLGIAYSSNIGGTGTILGSGTNYIIVEILKSSNYKNQEANIELNFATWMLLNIPCVILSVILAYVCLLCIFQHLPNSWYFWTKGPKNSFSPSPNHSREAYTHEHMTTRLKKEYEDLGPITFHQIAVAVLFFSAIFLLFFRDPRFISGWDEWITSVRVEDSTPVIFVVFLLFVIPKNLAFLRGEPYEVLLHWASIEKKLPWGLVLMSGGAFALSDGATKSGFSDWLGCHLKFLEPIPRPALLLLVLTLTALFTEVVTNRACASIILPVLIALSKTLKLHPLYLGLPTTVMCSYGFILPIATNPNAIVFAYGKGDLRIIDMLRSGAVVNCISILVVFLTNVTVGEYIFKYSEYSYTKS